MSDSEYIIKVSEKSAYWGRRVDVAVLEVDPGVTWSPMISTRARVVRGIVRIWEDCNVGITDRCASEVCKRSALELAAELNRERPPDSEKWWR